MKPLLARSKCFARHVPEPSQSPESQGNPSIANTGVGSSRTSTDCNCACCFCWLGLEQGDGIVLHLESNRQHKFKQSTNTITHNNYKVVWYVEVPQKLGSSGGPPLRHPAGQRLRLRALEEQHNHQLGRRGRSPRPLGPRRRRAAIFLPMTPAPKSSTNFTVSVYPCVVQNIFYETGLVVGMGLGMDGTAQSLLPGRGGARAGLPIS